MATIVANSLECSLTPPIEIEDQSNESDKQIQNLKVMFLLATAYSSNIGGTGVVTGSSTNIIALDLVRKDA